MTKKIFIRFITIFMTLLLMSSFFLSMSRTASAEEESSSGYTDVMDDLERNPTFDSSLYPSVPAPDKFFDPVGFLQYKSQYMTLKIVQIAESSDGELFVYLYNPSYDSFPLTATTIRLCTELGDNLNPLDYKLKLVSKHYMFSKYVVEDLEVSADEERYYFIVALHCLANVDGSSPEGLENITEEEAIEVSYLWTVKGFGDDVTYSYKYKDSILVTDRYVGFVEYYDGGGFFAPYEATRSHFIAFNTSIPMDKLYEADVSYSWEFCKYWPIGSKWLFTDGTTVEDEGFVPSLTVTSEQTAENSGWGLFADEYTWNRIEPVSDFLKSEGVVFDSEAEKQIVNKQWVLRFVETEICEWEEQAGSMIWFKFKTWTKISNVTILRLNFDKDGVTYNLAVVDDKTTGSNEIPSGSTPVLDIWEVIKKIFALIIIAVLLAVLLPFLWPVLSIVFKAFWVVFKWLLKGAVWLIVFPFNLIKPLAEKVKNKRAENKESKKSKGNSIKKPKVKAGKKK
jgi:hypothetical protein